MRKTGILLTVLLVSLELQAMVTLAPPFRDNAVLQRKKSVPVWGRAEPGETVAVEFAGQKAEAKADAAGKWRVDLAPMEACREGRALTAGGKSGTAAASNVVVGEVWLCSGQSNMALKLWAADRPETKSADPHVGENTIGAEMFGDKNGGLLSQLVKEPLLRLGVGIGGAGAVTPQDALNRDSFRWTIAVPEDPSNHRRHIHSWGGGVTMWDPPDNLNDVRECSAVAYYFGLTLCRALQVPVGVMDCSFGGSPIEPWMPPCGITAHPELGIDLASIGEQFAKSRWPFYCRIPTTLYNAMLSPFVPFALRGALWYQGEDNLGDGGKYCTKLHALYDGWAKVFGNPEFKFYVVQLPVPFPPEFCEAQAKFAAEEPNARMAVINDCADADFDLHPRNKLTVGLRLAALALGRDYGFTNLVCESPVLKSHRLEGNRYILSFDHAKEIWRRDGFRRPIDNAFTVAGADGKFYPAMASVTNGNELVVWSDKVSAPQALHYMFDDATRNHARVCNEVGLPLGVFRFSDKEDNSSKEEDKK